MPDKKQRQISPYGGGVFESVANRIKLILRLMGDPRVKPLLKLLPLASVVYLVFPDLMPGPIDDAAIILLSTYLFVELCPPEVVQEHIQAIERTVTAASHDPDEVAEIQEEDIIEGEIVDGDFQEDEKSK